METRYSIIEKSAGVLVAVGFMTIAMMFIALGCTFLPVIGILAALPTMAISLHFLALNPKVLAPAHDPRQVVTDDQEHATYCPWPPQQAFCSWPQNIAQGDAA
jgi:hypothetical protein